jgi:Leucine-rich repeat (LRR) protein
MKHLKTYENKNGITFKEWLKHKNININTLFIDCCQENLIDLNGIEEFKNLEQIYCSINELTELPELNGLVNLTIISCSVNNLTELPDLSNLKNLNLLRCTSNNLERLPDLSNLTKLKHLDCYDNKLPFNCTIRKNNLGEYLEWHKKEYPWIWDAKKYNL